MLTGIAAEAGASYIASMVILRSGDFTKIPWKNGLGV